MSHNLLSQWITHPDVSAALHTLHINDATPVQAETIPAVLKGADIAACAPTGSGKTLAFLLPMVQQMLTRGGKHRRGIRALILSPTRELARQIVATARSLCRREDINVVAITGGDHKGVQQKLLQAADMLVVTPGRMAEFVKNRAVDLSALQFLVIDEADRALSMGLADDVMRIAKACGNKRQSLLFSATLAARGMDELVGALTEADVLHNINIAAAHKARLQQVILADDFDHKARLLPVLLQQYNVNRAVVFANTRERVEKLQQVFLAAGLHSQSLHGEMDAKVRKRVLQRFSHGRNTVLVATDLAARGLDIVELELVVNADLPYNVPAFIHRAGRTARAANRGTVVSLVTAQSWNLMADIERYLGERAERVTLPGLVARFKGPKKIKSSGKVAGKKKTASQSAKQTAKKTDKKLAPKSKKRHRDRKDIGKRRTAKAIDKQ